MDFLRTPDERFTNLPEFDFAPHYTELKHGLRMAHVQAGEGETVLLLHGEPTWSFLYRKMIKGLAANGFCAVAPDLIGFGRSDKPTSIDAYSYLSHMNWMYEWIEKNKLNNITLFCQDWGSLIGLRMVGEKPELFSKVVVANGTLPIADRPANRAFKIWRAFARYTPIFPVGRIIQFGTITKLSSEEIAAYNAPFPSEQYKKGVRAFPHILPIDADNVAIKANRKAWDVLRNTDIPLLTAFGKKDPILGHADKWLQRHVKGAQGQDHQNLHGSHFVQEDCGLQLVEIINDFARSTSS